MSTDRERLDEVGKKIKREADGGGGGGGDWPGRRLGPVGSLNAIIPCAACKLLRRRCAQECPFSPYFSPHEPQKFASVHKVFGASNVSKMLMEVPEAQRADAANSLVYEANMRLRDPVYGCLGAISALQQQVQALEAELRIVRAEIWKHKCRQASSSVLPTSRAALLPPPGDVLAAAPPVIPSPPPCPASAASSSSIYTTPPSTSSTDYSSITSSGNVTYFA